MKRPLVKSVPLELLWTGYHWESVREHYFLKCRKFEKAQECLQLRQLYKQRLWVECGVEVQL